VRTRVARRYTWTASHRIPGHPVHGRRHVHDYTLEVVGEGDPVQAGRFIIDTDAWDEYLEGLIQNLEDCGDMNAAVGEHNTSVEALARYFLGVMDWDEEPSRVVEVTVWEDDRRWGRCSC
jgi:6-pyruvoyl-tetrahydropterin synthase